VLRDWKNNEMRRTCGLALLTLTQKTIDLCATDLSRIVDGEEWIDELCVKWEVKENSHLGGVKVINLRVMLKDYVLADSIMMRDPKDSKEWLQ
jgi:hypothetical protein